MPTDHCFPVRKTYYSMDVAKMICALLIISAHVSPFGIVVKGETVQRINFALQNILARTPTPFFFVCTGFLLFRNQDPEHLNMDKIRRCALRLAGRYAVWSLVYLPLSIALLFEDERGLKHAIFSYIRNFFLTSSYRHLWYLNAAAFAVALTGFFLWRKFRPAHVVAISFAFYLAGLLEQSWFGFLLPLREQAPQVWSLLVLVKKVIVTTRNGLFDGFFYVALGMGLALGCFRVLSRKKALAGLLVSLTALTLEAGLLERFGSIRGYDMYLCSAFCCFFGFQAMMADGSRRFWHPAFRSLSALMYYVHLMMLELVKALLQGHERALSSPLPFLMTVATSVLVSLFIMEMSRKEKGRWLGVLYR